MKYYLYGAFVNLLFLLIIRLTVNTEVKTTYWHLTDATEYIAYAETFLSTGTFYDINYQDKEYIANTDSNPGYRRTVGYPLILSFFIYVFGDNWLLPLQIFNCLFFALLYLIVPNIIKELFEIDRKKQVFWVLLLLGIVFARVPQVLNNTIFTVFLFLSIYLGIIAIKRNKWWLYISYILLISFTATIRLNLSWFFLFNILLFLYLCGYRKLGLMVITSAILLFTCNFNSFRNLYNHGVYINSSISNLSLQIIYVKM